MGNSSSIPNIYVVDPFKSYEKSEMIKCHAQFVKSFSEIQAIGPNGIIIFDVFAEPSHKGIDESIAHIENFKNNFNGLFIAMGQYGGMVLDDKRLLAVMKHVHGYIPAESAIHYINNILGGLTMLNAFQSDYPTEQRLITCEKIRQIIFRVNHILLERYFRRFPLRQSVSIEIQLRGGLHLKHDNHHEKQSAPDIITTECWRHEIENPSYSLN